MVAFTASYPLTTDLNGSSSAGGFSVSAVTAVGTGFAAIFEAKLLVQPGTTSINVGKYVTFTITPDETVEEWTPGIVSWSMALRNAGGTATAQVRSSDDTYAAAVGSNQTTTSTVAASKSVDLSGLGVQTGPLTVRLLLAAPASPNGVFITGLSVAGEYVPAGGVDVDLLPAGIASAEAFGTPVLVIVQPVDLSPEGIASGEAFGTPAVEHGAPVAVASYPSGQDVANFLGTPGDARLVAVAEVHVGVITHFARVYTRGNGFYVEGVVPELASVVLAATGRLVANPEQIDITVGTVRRAGSFKGWSLAEQRVLNEYRGVSL